MNIKTTVIVEYFEIAGMVRMKRCLIMPARFEADHPFFYFIAFNESTPIPIFSGKLQSIASQQNAISHDEL